MASSHFQRFALLLCLLGAGIGIRPASGQATAALGTPNVECLTPLTSACDITVPPGSARVPINVRIVRDGQPVDSAVVTFTTSNCCLEPPAGQQARTNATGVATITWAGTVRDDPAAPVRVYVWGRAASEFRDSIVIRANMKVAYEISPVDRYFIWFRDEQITESIDFRITRTDSADVTEAECNRIQVAFTPHLGGTAGPSPANAAYHGPDACTVGASWRLANTVGTQFLNAKIAGTEGSMRVDANVTAIARHQPRFIAGFARFVGDDKGEGEEGGALKSIFGVDFPVFYEDVCAIGLCKRLRVVVGSSFLDPQDDYYGGVVLIPLIFGTARESIPIQATANLASQGRPFLALTVDATSVLQMALNSLVPK
jgi:hypothetical protein